MERNRIVSHTVKKNRTVSAFHSKPLQQYIGLMALLLVGSAIGALYVRHSGVGKTGFEGTGFFLQDILSTGAASKGFLSLAASAFFPVALLMCTAFLFGLCAIGTPFELLVPVIHGAWLGAAMACIDVKYGVKGLGICILFILPQALITALAVIVASREGIKLSWSVAMNVFKSAQKPLLKKFKIYCYKYVICFLLLVIAAVIEALSIVIFANIFFT